MPGGVHGSAGRCVGKPLRVLVRAGPGAVGIGKEPFRRWWGKGLGQDELEGARPEAAAVVWAVDDQPLEDSGMIYLSLAYITVQSHSSY